MKSFARLETVLHVTPLGLSCVDIATLSPVTTGLRVTAVALTGSARQVSPVANRSGVYVFNNLPGLHEFEYADNASAGTDPFLASPPVGREYAITVEDPEGRYLSWGLTLTLPRKEPLKAFLFSAPTRAMVSGLTVIRGALRDASRLGPDGEPVAAAHARIEAEYVTTSPPTIYVAIADGRGQFALFLPSPNPLQPPAGTTITSPYTPGRSTISELRWPVTLSFFYEPARQKFVCRRPDGRIELIQGQRIGLTDGTPPTGWTCVPDLPSLLRDQAAATISRPASSPAGLTLQTEIEFGKDTVLRTATDNSSEGDTSVWIAPRTLVSP